MRDKQLVKKGRILRKALTDDDGDDLRPEYDFSKMKGERGKYFHRAWAGTGVRLLDPEIAKAFPDDASVNQALGLLLDLARSKTRPTRKAS